MPALIRRFHEAKINKEPTVTVWGSGDPRREFLHVDDLADACVFLMASYSDPGHVNVGTGTDISISEVARAIGHIVYPEAKIVFDKSKPDGMPRKLLDVSKLSQLGWNYSIELETGIKHAYQWFEENYESARGVG